MESQLLQPGDELQCPHCRRWHPVVKKYAEGTDYTLQMLMWECRGGSYYAGQVGTVSRHPNWSRKDLFEVNARAASATSLEGMRPMVASLLAQRFNLVLHREQKTLRGAVLAMAREDRRPGPKLSKCEDPNAPLPPPMPVRVPRGGYLLQAWCRRIASLVAVASNVMRVPVVDRTGLDGLWSYFTFYAGPEPVLATNGDNALPFPAALNDELWLRLRDSNGPFDVLVIDSVQPPTPD